VPVYFHVVTDGAIGSLTTRQINDQMRVLNQTFAGAEGGDQTGFSFQLAGVTRTDNAAWFYAGPGGIDEHSMKATLHQGGPNALNLYSTTASPYLGWAYLPSIVTKPGQAYLDGIVVDWESMLGTSTTYAGQYDQGETATHEVGHWLDLEHTFYRGCSARGDFVDDTPAQKTPTSGCPAGKDTCSAPGLDPIHNYMDYSFDTCYTEFTPGQSQRMRDAWLFYRASG
jgi:Pregnancy-associated plasma protein-A